MHLLLSSKSIIRTQVGKPLLQVVLGSGATRFFRVELGRVVLQVLQAQSDILHNFIVCTR